MMKNTKLNLIITIKGILLVGCFIFSVGCQSLLYHPTVHKIYDPSIVELTPEDIYFKSSDGNTLHAWYFAAKTPQAKGTILYFHGNAGNLTSHFLAMRWMPDAGYNYLIFDYPGFGTSSGKPNPESTVKAGIAAAEWLMTNKKPEKIIIYGSSLGGIVALRTAEEIKAQIPISHIIIEASFDSYQGIGRKVLSRSWITWLFQPLGYVVLSDKWAPHDISTFSPIPMLFIAGDKDRTIEYQNSEEMFKRAKDPKQLWIIPGGQHGNLYDINEKALRQRLLDYLK